MLNYYNYCDDIVLNIQQAKHFILSNTKINSRKKDTRFFKINYVTCIYLSDFYFKRKEPKKIYQIARVTVDPSLYITHSSSCYIYSRIFPFSFIHMKSVSKLLISHVTTIYISVYISWDNETSDFKRARLFFFRFLAKIANLFERK